MDAREELTDELRALLRLLNELDISNASATSALAHARALRAALVGGRRLRWYEGEDTRASFDRFSMFRGKENAVAVPMASRIVTRRDGSPAIEARVTCPLVYEGPPGGVHGGYVAGLFDDVLGSTQQLVAGGGGLTGTLTVRYRSITPLETELVFSAWLESVRERRIVARATCRANGVVTADAKGLFVRVDMAEVARHATDRLGSTP